MSVVLQLTDEELLEIKHNMQQEDDVLAVQAAVRELLNLWRSRLSSELAQGYPTPNEALLALAGQDCVDPSAYLEQRLASMV